VACAHGPLMFDMLGEHTKLLDPILVAAAAGAVVLAEPSPGPAGQAMQTRLTRLGVASDAAMMLPVRLRSRLTAFIEIGRASAFTPRAIAAAGELVDALVAKLEQLS